MESTEKVYRFPAHFKRYCAAHDCIANCPIYGGEGCALFMQDEPDEAERIIMAWAKGHPEPVYPTLVEWLLSKYPNADDVTIACYGIFLPRSDFHDTHCRNRSCTECRSRPMTAEIAAKLGVEAKEDING